MKKNIILADCEYDEVASLVDAVNNESKMNFICKSVIANWGKTGIFSELKRYFMYFYVTFKIFLGRKNYDYILGWQQFYALVFCFWCRLFRVKKVNRVVVINFTYKDKSGFAGNIYKKFMKTCLSGGYIEYIHVPSENYAKQCCIDFNLPPELFIVTTFGINDMYEQWKYAKKPDKVKNTEYALAIGRSNRDYDFLLDVWKEMSSTLVIISDTFKPKQIPNNVILIDDVSGDDQYPWIINSNAVILSLADGRICSGDTVLLTSMSFEKTVIVTKPSTLSEMYIINGQNGLLISKNIREARSLISDVLNTEKYSQIGKNARQSFLESFSRERLGHVIGQKLK